MEAMRESWTDDRLDELNGKVDALRIEMRTEFASVRGEMKAGFDKIDERFERIDKRFERIDERFEKAEIRSDERFEAMMDRLYSMQRLMIQFCGAAMAALLGMIAALVAGAVQL
jgi:predicted nuclease with TOPRIM domain